MRRLVRAILAVFLLALASPSLAIGAVQSGPPKETPAAAGPAIEAERDSNEDELITRRITGIFSELPELEGVTVSVEEGVVTLEGLVPTPEDKLQAEGIAQRVSGVVTVQNKVERDVSVGQGIAGLGDVSGLLRKFVEGLPLIGAAILIAILIGSIGYALASLKGFWRWLAPNPFLAGLLASAVRLIFVLVGIVVALKILGAGTLVSAMLGGAGLIGIALSFALRDTLENYAASVLMSVRQPFRANDHIVINDYEGRVIRLTSRATILMTLDGNHLRIPNSTVFKSVILNYTRNPHRRFDFMLGIDAEDDATAARKLGTEVLRSLDFVLDDPEPQGRVEEVGDSNIVMRFLGWIDQRETDWYKAKSRAIPAVKDALERAGFAIPEPIYRLRFDTGAPLPIEKAGADAETPEPVAPSKSRARVRIDEDMSDTSAETVVAEMVEAERASPASQKDLLDSSRPVE